MCVSLVDIKSPFKNVSRIWPWCEITPSRKNAVKFISTSVLVLSDFYLSKALTSRVHRLELIKTHLCKTDVNLSCTLDFLNSSVYSTLSRDISVIFKDTATIKVFLKKRFSFGTPCIFDFVISKEYLKFE